VDPLKRGKLATLCSGRSGITDRKRRPATNTDVGAGHVWLVGLDLDGKAFRRVRLLFFREHINLAGISICRIARRLDRDLIATSLIPPGIGVLPRLLYSIGRPLFVSCTSLTTQVSIISIRGPG
jgi:hypothetical protein